MNNFQEASEQLSQQIADALDGNIDGVTDDATKVDFIVYLIKQWHDKQPSKTARMAFLIGVAIPSLVGLVVALNARGAKATATVLRLVRPASDNDN